MFKKIFLFMCMYSGQIALVLSLSYKEGLQAYVQLPKHGQLSSVQSMCNNTYLERTSLILSEMDVAVPMLITEYRRIPVIFVRVFYS